MQHGAESLHELFVAQQEQRGFSANPADSATAGACRRHVNHRRRILFFIRRPNFFGTSGDGAGAEHAERRPAIFR